MNRNKALAKGIFILLALVSTGPAFASVSLCSQSLLRDDYYIASLEGVARMRMQADLAKADGQGISLVSRKGLEQNYHRKYTDLVEGLSTRFSKAEIDEMLRSHIIGLQKEKLKMGEELTEARAEARRGIDKRLHLVEHVELPFDADLHNNALQIIPGTDSIIVMNDKYEVILFDLKTRNYTTVRGPKGLVSIIPGSKKILVFEDEIKIVDVETQEVIQRTPLTSNLDFGRGDFAEGKTHSSFDPTGRYLAFTIGMKDLMTLDMQNYQIRSYSDVKEFGFTISNFLFINNREVLVASGENAGQANDLVVLDISKHKAQVIPGSKNARNFRLVQNKQKVLFDSFQSIDRVEHGFFDVQNMLAPPLKFTRQVNSNTSSSNYRTMPETDYVALALESFVNIYRVDDLTKPVFNFDRFYHEAAANFKIVEHAYAPNGESAVILYRNKNNRLRSIDYYQGTIDGAQ
jgi:hypothetical protein